MVEIEMHRDYVTVQARIIRENVVRDLLKIEAVSMSCICNDCGVDTTRAICAAGSHETILMTTHGTMS
jgi:hypothetical protein